MFPNGKNKKPIHTAEQIGALVRQHRKDQKLTQKELAGLSGVGVRFISELERGKESCELGKTLHILAMLGIPLLMDSF